LIIVSAIREKHGWTAQRSKGCASSGRNDDQRHAILNPLSSILYPLSSIPDSLRGVSHIGALWYIPADTKSQNIQSLTEIETNS
jgi:hypothetical protein